MTQDSLALGELGKERGMAAAARGVGLVWMAEARTVIRKVAREQREFTSDHVWAAGLARPNEPRALGAALTELARAGFIEKTGKYVKTTQKTRHAAPIAVWRCKER